jgi:hypothetical protein
VTPAQTPKGEPFAVVELFSSEGCSSCPSADLLVGKLTAWARQNKRAVYPLVFHVDYWNNLGWRDVFSHEAFTRRQKDYARIFKADGVYTPEMIVNGSDAFVGSDEAHLQKVLDHELSQVSNVTLQISSSQQQGKLTVIYETQGFFPGDVIQAALVERGLSTDVTAGENAGRRLHHSNVVREFRSVPITSTEGLIEIPLDKIADSSQASVIVYVQNPTTMLVEAAQQLDLES